MNVLIFLAGAALSIQPLEGDPTRVVVTAENVPSKCSFSFYRKAEPAKAQGDDGAPVVRQSPSSLFGERKREGNVITFVPAVALTPGETYVANLEFIVGESVRKEYYVPKEKGVAPGLVSVYPGGETLPANLLKFYLHFDQAMREGREIFDQIHLKDAETGVSVKSPWRRQELWSDDAKRLILFIHPGRIKQGLQLRAEMGPVLEEGKKYTLTISGDVRGARGLAMGKDYEMSFKTSAPVREQVRPEQWALEIPRAGSGEPLIVTTGSALDPYLVMRHCEIPGKGLAKVEWNDSQKVFRFFPEQKWAAGDYELEVGQYLEDLAGNTPVRVFDTDLDAENGNEKPPVLKRSFTVD